MGRLSWYINRLRAMSVAEVVWRLQQKRLQRQEVKADYNPFPVYADAPEPLFNEKALGMVWVCDYMDTRTDIHLLGGHNYELNKRSWHKDFESGRDWPRECSYTLNYKGRDDIGDARTNWELNRHFQFALLSKAYHVSGDEKYVEELRGLLNDWIEANPFLVGISWTSVMEVAIRLINWTIARAFLSCSPLPERGDKLIETLDSGILGMAGYVARHYSRYSSANNHLLVEATALAYAGYAYNHRPWQDLAVRLLDEQLERQNFNDGVNREMSLHYQAFGMEAYALTIHLMKQNGRQVPERWMDMLRKQCEFVRHSMVAKNEVCEFGDDDEGKIIDLQGGDILYYRYVLQLCSLIIGHRYDPFNCINETMKWLFEPEAISQIRSKPLHDKRASRTFEEGGYSFLRSGDIFVGIDHAALGFGTIAAHGHADALSFQLFKGSKAIFIDPGTFIYHCNAEKRDAYRRSINHNTVEINGMEQSEMLGAFLWGRKAQTKLIKSDLSGNRQVIEARTVGLSGVGHTRRFELEGNELTITDNFSKECDWVATFMLSSFIKAVTPQWDDICYAECHEFDLISQAGHISLDEAELSPAYGISEPTTALRIRGRGTSNTIRIRIR